MDMKRIATWLLPLVLLASAAGCPGGGDDDQDNAGNFVLSCQSMVMITVSSCVEHYADPSLAATVRPSYTSVCQVQGGMVSMAPCPTANLVGTCTITGGGGGAYGIYDKLFLYAPGATEATARASCTGAKGTFEPGPAGSQTATAADGGGK
jgi:hypothetical protein